MGLMISDLACLGREGRQSKINKYKDPSTRIFVLMSIIDTRGNWW